MDETGSSGIAWAGLLGYLSELPFLQRPRCLILECVANLKNKRRVDQYTTSGCQQVKEALQELGYQGDWKTVCTLDFYLPQSRPRVYAVFIHVGKGCGPAAIHSAAGKAQRILTAAAALQCPRGAIEALEVVFQRASHESRDDCSTKQKEKKEKQTGSNVRLSKATGRRHRAFPRGGGGGDLGKSTLHVQSPDSMAAPDTIKVQDQNPRSAVHGASRKPL